MNERSPKLRIFLIALIGVALGIALARLSGGGITPIIAIVIAILAFVLLRLRTGR